MFLSLSPTFEDLDKAAQTALHDSVSLVTSMMISDSVSKRTGSLQGWPRLTRMCRSGLIVLPERPHKLAQDTSSQAGTMHFAKKGSAKDKKRWVSILFEVLRLSREHCLHSPQMYTICFRLRHWICF